MKKEDFPIDEAALNGLIGVNKKIWDKEYNGDKYIYINLSMVRMQLGWITSKLLFAKGIQEKTGCRIAAITWRENEKLTELLDSYGIEHYCIEKENRKHPFLLIKSLLKTAYVALFNGEGLKKMKCLGLPAGMAIYEDILRTSDMSTIRSIRNKTCIKKIAHLLWMTYSLDKCLKKNKPIVDICDDYAYHEGLQSAVFKKNGAAVINCNTIGEGKVNITSDGYVIRAKQEMQKILAAKLPELGTDMESRADGILNKRFAGLNGRSIDRGAFKDKKVYERDEAMKLLKLDPSKKTVVIMAHTFTDAVFNYGYDYYFRDYYDWTEQTLKIAHDNKNVNWILKPHPTRKAYHEDKDSIEKMFEKYRREGLAISDNDMSAESIKNIADVLVTIGGNAGAEFSCFGIPAVLVGKPYYSGLGYTIEPESFEEYKKLLMNADKIERLSEEQVSKAKKAFAWRSMPGRKVLEHLFEDEFSNEVAGRYDEMCNKMSTGYFESNKGTKGYNTDMALFMTEYFSTHDMKKCDFYETGRNISGI